MKKKIEEITFQVAETILQYKAEILMIALVVVMIRILIGLITITTYGAIYEITIDTYAIETHLQEIIQQNQEANETHQEQLQALSEKMEALIIVALVGAGIITMLMAFLLGLLILITITATWKQRII